MNPSSENKAGLNEQLILQLTKKGKKRMLMRIDIGNGNYAKKEKEGNIVEYWNINTQYFLCRSEFMYSFSFYNAVLQQLQ